LHPIEDGLAAAFFADALLPLRQELRRRGTRYLAPGPDAGVGSYWADPRSLSGGVERLGFGEQDGAAMLDRLRNFWLTTGEDALSMLHDELEVLRQRLSEPGILEEPGGQISYSAYPLF